MIAINQTPRLNYGATYSDTISTELQQKAKYGGLA